MNNGLKEDLRVIRQELDTESFAHKMFGNNSFSILENERAWLIKLIDMWVINKDDEDIEIDMRFTIEENFLKSKSAFLREYGMRILKKVEG
ncbi:MAG: hypothetical protein ACRCWG_10480 [Sarcina sp.]